MKKSAAILLAVSLSASAQPYIEVGVGAAIGGCVYHAAETKHSWIDRTRLQTHPGCSPNPLGLIAIGYQFNDQWRIQWDHWSSLPDTKDRGMEIISIRYRYTFR